MTSYYTKIENLLSQTWSLKVQHMSVCVSKLALEDVVISKVNRIFS